MTDERFRVVAYACDGGVVHEVNDLGFSAFRDVYVRNPSGCRYAVAETTAGSYRVFDLWSCPLDEYFRADIGKYRDFDTEDAAVMACVLTDHHNPNAMGYIAAIYPPLKG